MIDLRSDTVTQPCERMRKVMAQAPVGDDAYGEDESVNRLQDACKQLFQVEDALFVSSGMMANRLAFMSQTVPGNEVITEYSYHVNFFDSAPMAAVAGVVMNPYRTDDGILRPENIEQALDSKQRYASFAQSKLVSIENSINGWAGKLFPFEILRNVYEVVQQRGLRLHLDGARLFNAHIATGIALHDYARYTDTLSVCFSKSLGAPYGSMLMGSKETISKARRYRLWLGGGVHQIGMQAAGAHYALQHNLKRLADDHQLTYYFAKRLREVPGIKLKDETVETNMVHFTLDRTVGDSEAFLQACAAQGLLLFPWLPGVIRAVIHGSITRQKLDQAISIMQENLRNVLTNQCSATLSVN